MSRGALDLGLELGDILGRCRVLQIVERSSVGHCRHQRTQLKRGHADALPKAAHAADAALCRGQFLIGVDSQLFALDAIPGQLAQAELRGIVAHAIEAQFSAQLLEVEVVALCQRLGHIHAEPRQLYHGVPGNQSLGKCGQGYGQLDGRTGLGPRRQCQLLVHHSQDAAVRRVDDHRRAVHVAERVNRRLADQGVLPGRDIARANVAGNKRACRKPLVPPMAARSEGGFAKGSPGPRRLLSGTKRLPDGGCVCF